MKNKEEYNAILLVSDITKGMKSIGSKALLPLTKTTTILEQQINYLKKFYKPINIYICTGFEHDKIVKKTSKYKNIYYIYNQDYNDHNQASSLIQCLKTYKLNNAIIINNGLVLLDKIIIDKNISSILVSSKNTKTHFDIGLNAECENLLYLFYGLPNKWLEYTYLNKESIDKILEIDKQHKCNKLFLFEIINLLVDNGINFQVNNILSNNLPLKINNIKDLNLAKKYYEKYIYSKIK